MQRPDNAVLYPHQRLKHFQKNPAELAQLNDMIRGVAELNRLTEHSFLEIGQQVENFHQTAEEISADALQAVQLLEGTSGERALMCLQLLIERCSLWLDDAHSQSTQLVAVLEKLVAQMSCIARPLQGLHKMIRTLQGLRISTRIETVRMPGTGARVLADKLKNLTETIQGKVQQIEQQFEALDTLSQRILAKELTASGGPLKTVRQSIQENRQVLSCLTGQQVAAGQRAGIVQQQSDQIATHYGEIIVALQFQDITRQRLEHIQHALQDLAGKAITTDSQEMLSSQSSSLQVLNEVCCLQQKHLVQIITDFDDAVDSLMRNLSELAVDVRDLAAETRQFDGGILAETPGEHQTASTLLQNVTRQFEEILGLHIEASAAIRTVNDQVDDIANEVETIEMISEEMQLMALNAAVHAAHYRSQGAGLQVIAEQLQVLSTSAFAETLGLAEACRQVVGQMDCLEQLDETGRHLEDRLTALVKEGGELLQTLQENRQEVSQQIKKLSAKADGYGSEVAACLNTIKIHDRFRLQVKPLQDGLTELSQGCGSQGSRQDPLKVHLFKKMASRYTMHREREVHNNLLAAESLSHRGTESMVRSPISNDDLGDNIELF